MSENLNRRSFLEKSIIASTGAALGLSLEEKALLARTTKKAVGPVSECCGKGLPMGRIGNVKISRLIAGGNLINGYAHSRNLIYVSSLLKHYFTDEKVIETLQICEENGINTIVLNNADGSPRILKKYWKETGGKIQYIAQIGPTEFDLTTDLQIAVDTGAVGAFVIGNAGDRFFKKGRVDLLGRVVDLIKENGLIAGIGSHLLEVPMAVEAEGIEPDFYFKTLNTVNYHCAKPQQTIEFMKKVKRPWIGFKTLGAGVTHPEKGFKYAFEMGTDFITVGMYDFQVEENVATAKKVLSQLLKKDRQRPWRS